jgi:hypothetical protein
MILTHSPQISLRHEVRARSLKLFRQRLKPPTAIEFTDGCDHSITLGFCPSMPDCFRQKFFRNINRRFHASKLVYFGILSTRPKNPNPSPHRKGLIQIKKRGVKILRAFCIRFGDARRAALQN